MKDYNPHDIHFAKKMIAHHRDALAMANAETSGGKNEEMKDLALSILKGQYKESQQMQRWLEKLGLEKPEPFSGGMKM